MSVVKVGQLSMSLPYLEAQTHCTLLSLAEAQSSLLSPRKVRSSVVTCTNQSQCFATGTKDPISVADKVQEYHPLSKDEFKSLQEKLPKTWKLLDIASMFYVLNRASFSGSTLREVCHPTIQDSIKHPLTD